jgi:hypothetical protein
VFGVEFVNVDDVDVGATDVELAGTRTREHILTSRDRLLDSLAAEPAPNPK